MTQRRNWHVVGMMALSLIAIGLSLAGCDSKPTEKQSAALSAADHKAAFEKKLAALRPKAEAGDPTAQLEMGKAYEEGMASGGKSPAGDGAQKDPLIDLDKAAAWYEKAANQGNTEAQYLLGMLLLPSQTDMFLAPYEHPRDAANSALEAYDFIVAATWFEKAAKQKHAEAAYQLAKLYESGTGVEQNKLAAFANYLIAAEKGHAGAQYAVGLQYYQGAPQDPKGKCAHRYLSDDPNYGKGNVFDKFDSPFCLADKDPATAAVWWEKGAAQNDSQAQFVLANLYRSGEGVAKDASKAFTLYEAVAKLADKKTGFTPVAAIDAQAILGIMCSLGEGTPKDDAKAVEWYQKAASSGQASAQQNLGVAYLRGEGIATDNVLAYAWSNLAAGQGKDDAGKNRDNVARFITPAEIAEAQRISSSWKMGQIIARESSSAGGGIKSTGQLQKTGTGTLFVVGKAGQAITNQHVVQGCAELRIQGREGVAKLTTEDKINDLALIQIPGKVNATATIAANPESLRQGDDIVVFGFPLNAVLSSGGNLTPGVVSALTGLGNNTNQLQITAPIQPGSSGSPVLNKKGEVVGVVAMKLSDSKMARATGEIGQNVNFAVSGQTLKAFLDKHKVEYRNGAGFFAWEKDAADLAEAARTWTTVVECWR